MAAIREAQQPNPGEVIPFWDLLEPGEIRKYRQFQASVHQNGVPGIQMFKMQPCWNLNTNQSQNLQEAAVMRQDEKIKTLQGLLKDLKNTLTKERDEFTAKFSRQSRKIQDFEIKEKYQQNEIKEQKKAKDMAENMWKKTDEEKIALNAMIKSLEKEGCKINRLLQKKEVELLKSKHKIDVIQSDNEALRKGKLETEILREEKAFFQAKCNKLEEQLRYKEFLKYANKETDLWENKFNDANKETELWKNKFKEANKEKECAEKEKERTQKEKECAEKEKESMGKRAEKDKEVLIQKIKSWKNKCSRREKVLQTEKAAKIELQESIEIFQKELAILKKENSLLKEENYNLRYHEGFMGGFRRIKRFFVRIADRLLS